MLSIGTNSSSKDKNWMIMYDQDSVDLTYALSVSVNKNTGTSFLFSTNQSNNVFSMIKTGKDGNQVSAHHDYTLRYGWAGDMCIDSNDNVYHSQLRSATIDGTPQTGQLPVINKYDTSWNISWAMIGYESNYTDNFTPTSVKCTSDNNYVFATFHKGNNTYLVKFNSSGSLMFQKQLTSSSTIISSYMNLDSSDNVTVLSTTSSGTIVAKYNTNGILQWQRLLSVFIGYDAVTDINGNIYICGQTYSTVTGVTSSPSSFAHLIKYNSSGALQWQKTLNVSPQTTNYFNYHSFFGLCIDSDQKLYVTLNLGRTLTFPSYSGSAIGNGSRTGYAYILKYDLDGTLLWYRGFGQTGLPTETQRWNTSTMRLAIDNKDNLYVTHTTFLPGGPYDAAVNPRNITGIMKIAINPQHNGSSVTIDEYSNTFHIRNQSESRFLLEGSSGTLTDSPGNASDSTSSMNFISVSLSETQSLIYSQKVFGYI